MTKAFVTLFRRVYQGLWKRRFLFLGLLTLVAVTGITLFLSTDKAYASCGCLVGTCSSADCSAASNQLQQYHDDIVQHTEDEFDDDLDAFEDWLIDEFFEKEVIPAMAEMTTQMNAVAMQEMSIIGAFMDAKIQLDTQRLFQQLQAEAHKDYRPSDDFCWFGTNVRSMANSEIKGTHNTIALSETGLARQIGNANANAAPSAEQDYRGRWAQFVDTYCDPKDNNWLVPSAIPAPMVAPPYGQLSGLEFACDRDANFPGPAANRGGPKGATDPWRMNIDLDYTRLVEEPRTLDIDFTNAARTDDEEDVTAMSRNLYGHQVLTRDLSRQKLMSENGKKLYLELRSVAAKRTVAQYSFDSIVGLKSAGTGSNLAAGSQTREYLASIVKELMPTGAPDAEIYELIGEEPSYYSQLEIMSKKLYQNPDFYANLYDTPANVSRKKVAMQAIELMLDRAIYESQVRKEMVVSVLLSSKIRAKQRETNRQLVNASGGQK
ncbi:MAG: hypothetical protein H6858_08175 [Rhodospirillales bacterium]|nr:hypothetical protein [Rhodospirillales bacterium]